MKYTIGGLILSTFLFFAPVASAQHSRGNRGGSRHNGGQHNGGERGGGNHGGERGHGAYHNGERGRRLGREEFRAHFGPEHRFRPVFFGAYDGFFFGDFEFAFIDPYPVYWGEDAVIYVDDIDGAYFVYNPVYPGIRIAVVLR